MSEQQAGAVVVGIDGSAAGEKALEWAADEAERRELPLVIAHAGHIAHGGALVPDTAQAAMREIRVYGEELLKDALATVLESHTLADVRTEVREAHPADLLIELSQTASVLVVGRGNEGPLARFVFGSNTQRVAEHAPCPVVVVAAESPLQPAGKIVVAVSDSPAGHRAMQFACSEAAARGTSVHALRSWVELNWTVGGYGFPPDISFESLRTGEEALLKESVHEAQQEFPDLDITGELTDVPAHTALETAARDAALLVIGCRRANGSILPRVGPLASWLLHHSLCPVAIVGQPVPAAANGADAADATHASEDPIAQPTGQS